MIACNSDEPNERRSERSKTGHKPQGLKQYAIYIKGKTWELTDSR